MERTSFQFLNKVIDSYDGVLCNCEVWIQRWVHVLFLYLSKQKKIKNRRKTVKNPKTWKWNFLLKRGKNYGSSSQMFKFRAKTALKQRNQHQAFPLDYWACFAVILSKITLILTQCWFCRHLFKRKKGSASSKKSGKWSEMHLVYGVVSLPIVQHVQSVCFRRLERRRRHLERQKSNRFRLAKQQLCTCITLFCTFLCRRCTTTTWNCLISRFVEDGSKRQQLSFSFPKLWRSPLEFNSNQTCQHLTH